MNDDLWIRVTDRLPVSPHDVLVSDGESISLGAYAEKWHVIGYLVQKVKFWKPLPRLPKGEHEIPH